MGRINGPPNMWIKITFCFQVAALLGILWLIQWAASLDAQVGRCSTHENMNFVPKDGPLPIIVPSSWQDDP